MVLTSFCQNNIFSAGLLPVTEYYYSVVSVLPPLLLLLTHLQLHRCFIVSVYSPVTAVLISPPLNFFFFQTFWFHFSNPWKCVYLYLHTAPHLPLFRRRLSIQSDALH